MKTLFVSHEDIQLFKTRSTFPCTEFQLKEKEKRQKENIQLTNFQNTCNTTKYFEKLTSSA